MSSKQIKLASWAREAHFNFFKDFSQPYFNICVQVDMSALYKKCKLHKVAFSSAYLFALDQAIAAYPPMRYRILDDQPVCFDGISLSIVSLAADDTFRFVTVPHESSLSEFDKNLRNLKHQAHLEPLLSERVAQNEARADVCHVSVLPWLSFSSFSHATTTGTTFGIPKCVFGRFDSETGMTPLSIEVHHALMDGLHVAKFVAELQKKLDELRVNS